MPIADISIDHVAVAVPSVPAARSRWIDELGGAELHGGDAGTFESHQFRYANGGKLELLQPSAYAPPDDFVTRFLARRGAWIHHITWKVSDIRGALDAVAAHGLDAVDVRLESDHWKEAFLRPSQVGRIVLQIAQSAWSDADWDRFSGAPLPHPRPGAAALVGPLLAVESHGFAEKLYGGLLGGEARPDGPGRIAFAWPGCPLEVVCEEGPEPGPRALLVDGWDGRLPHHPRLGPPVRPRRQ